MYASQCVSFRIVHSVVHQNSSEKRTDEKMCGLHDCMRQQNAFNLFYLNAALALSLLTVIIWLVVI